MWQMLVAAAVAGTTGFVAKNLFGPNVNPATTSVAPTAKKCDGDRGDRDVAVDILKHEVVPIALAFDSPVVRQGLSESDSEGIFRFSSSGSRSRKGSKFGSKSLRKKTVSKFRGLKKQVEDRKVEDGSDGIEIGLEQMKSRRFAVRLKRRKTSKNVAPGKCGSCNPKDGSLFSWGLSAGIMYVMSAGKDEIKKLNSTIDETVKVVQELKSELYKRKSTRNLQASQVYTHLESMSSKIVEAELGKPRAEDRGPNYTKGSSLPSFDDGECRSVLTEEPETDMHVMDQLEAELESELKKLPWCLTEASHQDEEMLNLGEVKGQAYSNPLSGVLPEELNEKLCHVLIEKQENQIVELESELHSAQFKLHEKEVELQALKDCVRRLTEFSLSTNSDDEAKTDIREEWTSNLKQSAVGMKRPMER